MKSGSGEKDTGNIKNMIETIEIKNIQSHEHTVLELSKGVNVIKGTSHHGKSSIIRALRWCLQNKPLGEVLKSWFADKNDPMEVSIEFDNGYIVRLRDKEGNCYEVPGNKLEAMRADVPEEVLSISNMSEVNLSTQHETYFMLQDTPGEVARKLNQVVGLEIIDKSLKKGNSLIKDMRKRLQISGEEVESLEKDLEKYHFLPQLEKSIQKIDSKFSSIESLQSKIKSAQYIIKRIQEEEKELEGLEDWLTIRKPFQQIQLTTADLRQTLIKYDSARMLVRLIDKEEQFLEKQSKLINLQPKVNDLKNKLLSLKQKQQNKWQLNALCNAIQKENSTQNSALQQATKLNQQLTSAQKNLQTCDKCGAYKIYWRK